MILFLMLILGHGHYLAKAETSASPPIYLPEENFELSPVIDGKTCWSMFQ